MASGCIVGNAQMVKSWQEHQYANDRIGNGLASIPLLVAQQQSYDNKKGANQKQHSDKCDGLVKEP